MAKKPQLESRLTPPAELKTLAEKRAFTDIVNAYSGDFFNTGDMALLLNYVRLKLATDRLYKEVKSKGEVIKGAKGVLVPSPYFRAYTTGCTTMAQLAQKLRIAPSARMRQEDPRSSANKTKAGKDYSPGSDWRDHQNV